MSVQKEAHVSAMDKAKVGLMMKRDLTFFTSVFFSLKLIWDLEHPTAWTDGTQVAFSPKFFLSLNPEERIFLILHEVLHVAYIHMERMGNKDRKLWNQAADYAINNQLISLGYIMPEMGLADARFDSMAAEQIYQILGKEKDSLPSPSCNGQLAEKTIGEDLRDGGMTPVEIKEEVQDILIRAAIRAKQEGSYSSVPGDIQVMLDKLLNPKLPWHQILSRYMTELFGKEDWSFTKPNRRFLPNYILPGLKSQSMRHVAIAVDTSGSVSDSELTRFVTEMKQILTKLNPTKMIVIQFDTEIKQVNTVSNVRELMGIKFTGRGGTQILPVLTWAAEHKPKVLLVFTDGEFRQVQKKPEKTELVWLIHDNPRFGYSFGKVIHYTMEN